MKDEVNQLPSSPLEESSTRDESSDQEGNPDIDICTPLEKEFNIMTQGNLDRLRELYSFPSGIQARIREEKVDKLSLDQVVMKFFHIVSLIAIQF